MKKPILSILTAILLLFFVPAIVRAETDTAKISIVEPAKVDEVDVAALSARVAEIQAMDVSMLSKAEKKAIRKELSGIKSDLKATNKSQKTADGGTGVYISVGAIIIIILLLIIIF